MTKACLVVIGILAGTSLFSARGEIFERDLGTDAQGKPVTGYVFQAGRSFRGHSSGLRPRRVYRPSSGRGIVRRDYGLPYWYVPVIPLHCGGGRHYGSYFSIWHGHTAQTGVSVTVIR